ncbi:lysosomal proton-coupled steroid conjugate and bile acid symporter SLC46A3-like isoform X3 [Maniola hyperantus]|uniref:lysosomal proton-coupled steroid conjugate and bile acid symporter SLC46A3-like isoform X3 n=1 Tax=Aphantopus hyperantus TaxID=2795564 RepID=UPI001567D21F|nr:proton-coupled folate transporter-like [Maniola hyperantus]
MTDSSLDLHELEKLRSTSIHRISQCPKPSIPEASHKWRLILEPALVGAMMAINLAQTSLQNFYLRTACHELNYTADICDRGVGEEFRAAEAGSQALVSSINVSRSFVGSLISTIVLLFVGPWSDCSGRRKPLLIVPLIGMCVTTTGVLLMVTFPGASTAQVLYVVQIPISMGGNFGLLLAASFSHIGDLCHTTGRDVTRTMGTHRAAIQIAHVVGSVSGPLLYRRLGFYGVFPLVLLLQVASLIYVVVMVRDVNVNRDNKVTVLNLRLPLNAVQCLVRKREGHKRIVILLMLVVALGDRMLLSAEVLLAYMYYRYKFQWDDVLFGSFLAYRNTISFAGTLLILTIFKRRLRLSDELVGVLSCTSYIIATSSLIAATTTIFVFIIPIIGIISQGSQVVQRPLLNKQILPTEQGKIYSVLGALESATQTFSSSLYSLLYTKTVSSIPDAWLIPGIILAVIQLFSYLLTRRLQRITPSDNVPEKNIPLHKFEASRGNTKEKDLINKEAKSALAINS